MKPNIFSPILHSPSNYHTSSVTPFKQTCRLYVCIINFHTSIQKTIKYSKMVNCILTRDSERNLNHQTSRTPWTNCVSENALGQLHILCKLDGWLLSLYWFRSCNFKCIIIWPCKISICSQLVKHSFLKNIWNIAF